MKDESVFVSIDEDLSDVVVIDMDGSFADFVTVDDYVDTDFITLSNDVEIASDANIIDVFSGMDDADISIIV
ncbi:MAG: hypothetical protein LBP50_05235 [Tannerella sp.]|jgi:hypothetical protein|nr:hypothetical protein [Tannerella sp.]